jgi:hypothetical protein
MATWTWKASTTSSRTSTTANGASATTVPRIVLLGREQTEEWKGWMQFMFIFYHYYRVYSVYNEIRVFVSAYVWMVRTHFFIMRCCFIEYTLLERGDLLPSSPQSHGVLGSCVNIFKPLSTFTQQQNNLIY